MGVFESYVMQTCSVKYTEARKIVQEAQKLLGPAASKNRADLEAECLRLASAVGGGRETKQPKEGPHCVKMVSPAKKYRRQKLESDTEGSLSSNNDDADQTGSLSSLYTASTASMSTSSGFSSNGSSVSLSESWIAHSSNADTPATPRSASFAGDYGTTTPRSSTSSKKVIAPHKLSSEMMNLLISPDTDDTTTTSPSKQRLTTPRTFSMEMLDLPMSKKLKESPSPAPRPKRNLRRRENILSTSLIGNDEAPERKLNYARDSLRNVVGGERERKPIAARDSLEILGRQPTLLSERDSLRNSRVGEDKAPRRPASMMERSSSSSLLLGAKNQLKSVPAREATNYPPLCTIEPVDLKEIPQKREDEPLGLEITLPELKTVKAEEPTSPKKKKKDTTPKEKKAKSGKKSVKKNIIAEEAKEEKQTEQTVKTVAVPAKPQPINSSIPPEFDPKGPIMCQSRARLDVANTVPLGSKIKSVDHRGRKLQRTRTLDPSVYKMAPFKPVKPKRSVMQTVVHRLQENRREKRRADRKTMNLSVRFETEESKFAQSLEFDQEICALSLFDDSKYGEGTPHNQISWEDMDFEEPAWWEMPDLDADDDVTADCKAVLKPRMGENTKNDDLKLEMQAAIVEALVIQFALRVQYRVEGRHNIALKAGSISR